MGIKENGVTYFKRGCPRKTLYYVAKIARYAVPHIFLWCDSHKEQFRVSPITPGLLVTKPEDGYYLWTSSYTEQVLTHTKLIEGYVPTSNSDEFDSMELQNDANE